MTFIIGDVLRKAVKDLDEEVSFENVSLHKAVDGLRIIPVTGVEPYPEQTLDIIIIER